MPKATTCKLDGRIIDVEEALYLRQQSRSYPRFRCRECNEFVRPHKKGTTGQAAHFEHQERSPGCSLGS